MFASLLTLIDPGDDVLIPEPGYPAYATMVRLLGGRPVAYPLRYERAFHVDPADVAARMGPATRALILCNPSNPTGAVECRDNLARLADILETRGVPWISDEIYSAFTYDGAYVSLADVAAPNGLVVSSLSKDLAMTGWRVGWVAGPEALVGRIVAAHQYVVTCAPTVSQNAARAAFGAEGDAERAAYREIFRARRARMADELRAVPGVRFHVPEGAFYFFVDVSRHGPSLPLCMALLERRQVITVAGTAFGPSGEGFLRLSFAASEDDITRGIRAIAQELARP
jgi:aspartate/methionine/tyrosine aminotransferase